VRQGRRMSALGAVLVTLLLMLSACGGAKTGSRGTGPEPADPLADPGQPGALAAMQAYGEARRLLDLSRAYDLLTPSARAAFTPEEFSAVYGGQERFAYTSAAVESPAQGVARGYLISLVVTRGLAYGFDRYPYTLRYEQGRWGVAQGGGLEPRILAASREQDYTRQQQLAGQWLAIDPFSWEAQLERFYALKDTNQPAEAKAAWDRAIAEAPAEERPALYATLAMLYALNQQPGPLLETAGKALEAAREVGAAQADRYDLRWRAGMVIAMARASRFQGHAEQAERYFLEARLLDPHNPDVERFAQEEG
jgi:hypothetical protein